MKDQEIGCCAAVVYTFFPLIMKMTDGYAIMQHLETRDRVCVFFSFIFHPFFPINTLVGRPPQLKLVPNESQQLVARENTIRIAQSLKRRRWRGMGSR